jgi:hypothetical protein
MPPNARTQLKRDKSGLSGSALIAEVHVPEQDGRMSYKNLPDSFWKDAPRGMRICAMLMLVTLIPSALNYYLNLGWLGSYDRLAFGASAIFGLILAHRIHFWHAERR